MKAEELRIGNWINDEEGKPGRDMRINGDAIQALYESQRKFTTHLYRSWKPVPLSESWLLKFGFEQSENTSWMEIPYTIGVSSNGSVAFFLEKKWVNTYIKISHVHQLQNLFFSLTGKELVASIRSRF